MQQRQTELDRLGIQVVVVTFELNVVAENYLRQSQLSWPFLIDKDRKLYHGYGMNRGRWWDLAGPSATWVYFKLFAKGRMLKRTTGDVTQLGGDIVIDANGIVRFHHVGNGPADRPDIDAMLAVIQQT